MFGLLVEFLCWPTATPTIHTLDDHGDALHSAANRMLVLRGSE